MNREHMTSSQGQSTAEQIPYAATPTHNRTIDEEPESVSTKNSSLPARSKEAYFVQFTDSPLHRKGPGSGQIAVIVVFGLIVVLTGVLILPLLWTSSQTTGTLTLVIPPAIAPVGQLVFSSSGQLSPNSAQGINDSVTVMLHSLKNPATGKALYAWLLPDQTNDEVKPIPLGKLPSHGAAQITYNDPNHMDLLTTYSAFRITEEDSSSNPFTPSLDQALWRYSGSIPATPIPGDENHYSFLSHLRHLLAKDPTLQALQLSGGLDIWLDRNSEKVLEYATAARDDWPNQGNSAALTHRQIVRILQYLDGANYSWQDTPSGTPWLIDAQAGHIGLLDITQSQQPPGYLSHVLLHLNGLINSPGATQRQNQLAKQIDANMQHIVTLYKSMRDDARTLVKMSDTQLRGPNALTLLDSVATKANAAYAGQLDPTIGKTQLGISAIHGQIQTLGIFNVMPVTK